MGEPAFKMPDEDKADIRPDLPGLRVLEGGGEGDGAPSGNLGSVGYDEANDDSFAAGSAGKSATGQAKDASNLALSNDYDSDKSSNTLYNPDAKTSRIAGAKTRLQKLAKNRLFIGVGAIGGVGLIAFLIFIFLFFSALKIPNFMSHITAYQFARVTRQISQNAQNITEEKMAVDSADNSLRAKIKARFNDSATVTKTKDIYSNLDKYRPNKIIKNFNRDGTFKLVYDGDRLKGITLTDRTVLLDRPTGFTKFIPGVKFKGDINFSQDIAPSLKAALKADDIGPITRSRVSAQIRKELGIGLVAWKVGEYTGKTPDQAKLQNAKDMVKAIEEDSVQASKTQEITDATTAFRQQLSADEKDPKALIAAVDAGGIDKAATNALDKAASDSIGKQVLGAVSPIYGVAVPVCLVYDGSSIKGSGPTINAQTNAQIKTYNYYASASSQIVNGYGADAQAVGAASTRLGTIENSPSEMRARGQAPDTSAYLPTQSSPMGNFTAINVIFNALHLGSTASSVANTIVESFCPVATNTLVAGVLGVVNIADCLNIFGGTETCIGEKAVQEGAQTFTGKIAGKFIGKFASEQAAKRGTAIGGYLTSGVKDLGASVAKITAATLITKAIVMQRANATHNGLQSNLDLTSDIDSGANQNASMVCQRQLACRPLNNSEVADSHKADQSFLEQQAAHKSVLTRTVGLHNPDSVLSQFASLTISKVKPTVFSDILNFGNTLLSPAKIMGSLFGSITHNVALAAGDVVVSDYGNVQWGYSKEETDLLANDPTYKPLENQYELDQHKTSDGTSVEDKISDHYKSCFDGSKPIGTLLENGDITRDSSGNVTDGSLCSPANLGPHNTDPNAGCGASGCGDLVFRWRVAQSYNNTLGQLSDEQDVTANDPANNSSASASSGGEGISPDGFVFPVKTTKSSIAAGSTLNGSTLKWCSTSLTNCHHDYNAADIFQVTGTPVVAVRDGSVVYEKNGIAGGTGSFVIMKSDPDNNGKSYIYYYAHLLAGSVKVLTGDRIKAGQELAQIGTSADAEDTATHLHIDAELSPPASTRQPCISAKCATPAFNFINLQPTLVSAYNNLPN